MFLFPCGTINSSDSTGTINNLTYSLWEPNDGCSSNKIFYNIVSQFENQILTTRQKAEPALSIIYKYTDIFNKEFVQIRHFVEKVGGDLNPFYTIDWSNGYTPSVVASVTGGWQIVIDTTSDYSATSHMKSNYVLVWDGLSFRVGNVTNINSATRLTFSKDYGNLTLSNAQDNSNVYPIYKVYFSQNPLANFEPSVYIGGNLSKTEFSGWMRQGTINFITKYKV